MLWSSIEASLALNASIASTWYVFWWFCVAGLVGVIREGSGMVENTLRLPFAVKAFWQLPNLQTQCARSSLLTCVFMCALTFDGWGNFLGQWGHLYGLAPVWRLMCD
jgi:hypothetical protein